MRILLPLLFGLLAGWLAPILLDRLVLGPHYVHVCSGGMDEISERSIRKEYPNA